MSRPIRRLFFLVLLLAPMLSCGAPAGLQIQEATFSHGLNDEMQPLNPGSDFVPDETVQLSLKLTGRPSEGTITTKFYWRDTVLAEASADLAEDSGGIVSIGGDTYVGFSLAHEQALPISRYYRAEVSYNDLLVATYTFQVVPPPEGIPSNIRRVTFALGVAADYSPLEETSFFAPNETVYLAGKGDLGWRTWLQTEWYVSGQLDEAGTRRIPIEDNITDAGFYFSYVPEQGWPPGEHLVVLTMNDEVVGRYPFAIVVAEQEAPLEETAFWQALPLPGDAEQVSAVEGVDMAFATTFPETRVLDFYGAWLRQQGWEKLAPTEGEVPPSAYRLWQKQGFGFLAEIKDPDPAGRTVVWLQFGELE